MKTLLEAIETEMNAAKSLTENGATAYASAGDEILDMNFEISALRGAKDSVITGYFEKIFLKDKVTAMKYLFYLADVRGGVGERHIFRACLKWLATTYSAYALAVMELIPEYTRWDHLVYLIEFQETRKKAAEILKKQLKKDLADMGEGKPVSLLAKWMPSEKTSSKETVALAKKTRKAMSMSSVEYRKMLISLRAYLNIIETKVCSGKWSEIDYETVPSKANLKYKDAFLRHDAERRTEYLDALKTGDVKINASVLQPHEIVSKYKRSLQADDPSLEELWKALPSMVTENTLVIRDGSGSMIWNKLPNSSATPLDVATAVALHVAEHTIGEWHNKFITFSSNPKIVSLDGCENLRDKLRKTSAETDCSNTDIYKTMKLILSASVKAGLSQADMPKTVLIISDMQFDPSGRGNCYRFNKTLFEEISAEYKEAGFLLPKICFWNVKCNISKTIPMQENELGLILCSGFSMQLLKLILSGKTSPLKILLDEINGERYQAVEEAIRCII